MYPILFKIGQVAMRSYGLLVALAAIVAFSLLYRDAKRKNFYANKILDLELVILLFGIVGARLLHVVVNLSFYKWNPLSILMFWHGGLAIYGGIIFAILAGWIFITKNKMPLHETADFIIPYMALGQAIGRVGCFLNGCCFGKEAHFKFLGVVFPGDSIYRYPTQLYAAILLFLIFLILKFSQTRPHVSGFVFMRYLSLYSAQRLFVDFFRGDNPTYLLGLTVSQIISVIVFFVAIFFILFKFHGKPKT